MNASTDTIRHAAALALGTVAAFYAGIIACHLSGRFTRKELWAVAVLYWGMSAVDAAGLVAVWAFGSSAEASLRMTLTGYCVFAALAAAALGRGLGRAVGAAAGTLLLRWLFSAFFAWTDAMLLV